MARVYNKALDLMGLALASVMDGKPNTAAKALTAASKHPHAARALSAILKANAQPKSEGSKEAASVRRAFASRVAADVDHDPELDLDLSGEEQRIEVEEADAFDEELLEDFEEAMAKKHTARRKAKAEAEDDEDEGEEEDGDDEDEGEEEDANLAKARLRRALSNLTRQRR